MGGAEIKITLEDWDRLKRELLETVDKRLMPVESLNIRVGALEYEHQSCSKETNQRLKRIEGLLDSGKKQLWRIVGKIGVILYRTVVALGLLYLAIKHPEIARAIGGML